MDLDQHAHKLGKLLSNFQSLELLLRVFLQGDKPLGLPPMSNLFVSPVGTVVPISDITNYDSLGRLIERYNVQMETLKKPTLDVTLVEVRDALAHGRVSSEATGEEQLRLLKFSKPSKDATTVTV